MKKKPGISKLGLTADFENNFGNDGLMRINVYLDVKVQDVPISGEIKYQIVKDIEDALKVVKEKYAIN